MIAPVNVKSVMLVAVKEGTTTSRRTEPYARRERTRCLLLVVLFIVELTAHIFECYNGGGQANTLAVAVFVTVDQLIAYMLLS